MAKIFIINDTSITAGVDTTSDVGSSSIKWVNGYFAGTITAGTTSVTGALIAGTTVSGTTASFGGGAIIGGSSTIGTFLISDSKNVTVGTGTGTTFATGTNQKLSFYNATAIVQPSTTGETVGFTAVGGTGVNDQSTFTGNVGTTAYRISDVVKALKNLGFLKQ